MTILMEIQLETRQKNTLPKYHKTWFDSLILTNQNKALFIILTDENKVLSIKIK